MSGKQGYNAKKGFQGFQKVTAGAVDVPTAVPEEGLQAKSVPGTKARKSAVNSAYERFSSRGSDTAVLEAQRNLVAYLDEDSGETYRVTDKTVELFGGEIEIHCTDSDYTVVTQRLLKSESFWSPAQYEEEEIASTESAEEAVDIARNLHEYGEDFYEASKSETSDSFWG